MEARQLTLDIDVDDIPEERYPRALLARPVSAPRLTSIQIEALKGIRKLQVDLPGPLTILTGPNNSGKSTILQAIMLGFDILRRCLDTNTWKLAKTGRAVSELDFLPVNNPRDLWHRHNWKPSKDREQYIRVGLTFDNGFKFTGRIRFLYGALNVGLEEVGPETSPETIKAVVSSAPVLIPASPGPRPHESIVALAHLHRALSTGEASSLLRNVMLQLQKGSDAEGIRSWRFVLDVIKRYFGVELEKINYDERRDLEVRAPFSETDYALDIVSAGSGLNQILQLAAVIAWRGPGLVLLDEPDAHLHTSLQMKLLDFLYELISKYRLQVILSTHSRDLISQAPLEAIIPVDLSRETLVPLRSLEHLLLEFERQGTVSNVDLALLYQTKKCLFVEGTSDCRILPKIVTRLGSDAFQGKSQVVTFEFGGVDNLRLVPKVVTLFERMIGAKLAWAVVRDRDANIPIVLEAYKDRVKTEVQRLHIWETYSVENLLLKPTLVTAALHQKHPGCDIAEDTVEALLEEALKEVEPEMPSTFVIKTQTAYRALEISEHPLEDGVKAAIDFLATLDSFEKKLQHLPGKRIFGKFVQLLQDRHQLTLRLEDIVAVLDESNAPDDIKRFVEMVSRL